EALERRFPTPIETAAYRIIQEALTNVARHAQVSEVVVRLRADMSRLSLEVQDEGIGFDLGTNPAAMIGCGLTGMRERSALLGGAFRIESVRGAGTLLAAELPFPDPASTEGEST